MARSAKPGQIHRRAGGVVELFVDANQLSFRVRRE